MVKPPVPSRRNVMRPLSPLWIGSRFRDHVGRMHEVIGISDDCRGEDMRIASVVTTRTVDRQTRKSVYHAHEYSEVYAMRMMWRRHSADEKARKAKQKERADG